MAKPRTLVFAALAKTSIPAAVQDEIAAIRGELDAQYRDRFVELTQTLHRQASALDRILHTLEILVSNMPPEARARVPGLRLADPGEDADLATVAADPIGAGYSLSQQAMADALQCSGSDVSLLLKDHPLKDDPAFAVVVRRGKQREIVNYHARAIDELERLIERPPASATSRLRKTVERIRRRRAGAR